MIWLTWRQHRGEAWIAAALVVLMGCALIFTGLDLISAAQNSESGLINRLLDTYNIPLLGPLNLLPLLLGMFVGAPLVAREFEQGTYRLVWTQGVTPFQWLRIKLVLLGMATLLTFGVLFAVLVWWNRPVDATLGSFRTFDEQGPVIFTYAFFGLALGIALGALLGKTLPATALTIPTFLLVRVGIAWLRTIYLPPLSAIWDFSGENPQIRDWILNQQYVDRAGHLLGFDALKVCVNRIDQTKAGITACYQANGIFTHQVYQPASRFWLFQGIETFIFLALAAGLIALAFWWIRRRIQN